MNTHTVITHTVVNIPYQHSSRDHTSGLTPPSTRDIGHQRHLPPLCRFERLTTLLSPMFTFIRCLVILLILLTVFLNMSLLYIINSFTFTFLWSFLTQSISVFLHLSLICIFLSFTTSSVFPHLSFASTPSLYLWSVFNIQHMFIYLTTRVAYLAMHLATMY